MLGAIYTEGRYRNVYEIAKRTGSKIEFFKIDDNLIRKIYNLKDKKKKKNAPSFHPRCRCTTVPYFNDEFTLKEKSH